MAAPSDIVIVGSDAAGLTAAAFAQAAGRRVIVLEKGSITARLRDLPVYGRCSRQ